ncbi:cleavage and polyadenylylation specificity factor subunit [Colletotrichum karsti]|uniref:Cleavage and polyadenylylation specificity factor subunit n=1 Tax=Colletotrichum karsti TaxID=1095194 RepID=A0A9P6LNW9_9PEZI|nr:cleavage and polyadenylylation specificity factor subunit [Colletotrichum karsti]KAF9880125.1 cleavage and polyadenylylation specificity factor subunit [Colletotrichum karsti]
MDIDEDDDFYAPEEPTVPTTATENEAPKASPPKVVESNKTEELEEGEEEDEGGAMDEDEDDSDIDIITERKDGTKAAPPTDIRNIPQRSASNDMAVNPTPAKKDDEPSRASPALGVPSADKAAAAASKSTIDVNANPPYPPAGKPITAVNIDEDLPENEKPWRKPGTDISDYFNYGFDEFTWALYAAKQEAVRGEYNADAIAAGNKKMMEDFGMMMMGGGMPGMPSGGQGGANPQAGGMPGMAGGMDGMPPEMQAMMQQMMGQGMDPSQMDPAAMSAMFNGMQGQGGGAGGQQGQGQNFGQGGFGGNQGQYGGYEQQGMGGNRGGFGAFHKAYNDSAACILLEQAYGGDEAPNDD